MSNLWCEVLRQQKKEKIRPDWFKILNQFKEQEKTNSYHSIEKHEKSSSESDIPELEYRHVWTKGNSSEKENKYEESSLESDIHKLEYILLNILFLYI